MDGRGLEGQVPSPLTELRDDRLGSVRLLLKRDDLIHSRVSGNKWRKLRYLLPHVQDLGVSTLLTFGGAYSNHVRAVAAAGHDLGLRTIGVIRGEERPYNDLLAAAATDGMCLHYLDRATYRRKSDGDVIDWLRRRFGDFYLVPEGGTTTHALPGCAEIIDEIDEPFDLVAVPVGTGGTLAGLATGLREGQRALGIAVLKGAQYLEAEICRLHIDACGRRFDNWTLDHRFHHGGFAKRTAELDRFLLDFHDRHGIDLDHVYVGKMLSALFTLAESGGLPQGSVVVAVVTGSAVRPGIRSRRHDPDLIV